MSLKVIISIISLQLCVSNLISRWNTISNVLPSGFARQICGYSSNDSSIYFIGGSSDTDNSWTTPYIYKYDIQRNRITFEYKLWKWIRKDGKEYGYNNDIIYFFDNHHLRSYNMITKEQIKSNYYYGGLSVNNLNNDEMKYRLMCVTFKEDSNIIYLNGGEYIQNINDSSRERTRKTFYMDLNDNTYIWNELNDDMNVRRKGHTCESIELDDDFLLFSIGGQNSDNDNAEYYSEKLNQWVSINHDITRRSYIRSVLTRINDVITIYIFGGYLVEYIQFNLDNIDGISLGTVPSFGQSREGSCAIYVEPNVYVFGGHGNDIFSYVQNTFDKSNSLITISPTKMITNNPTILPSISPTLYPTISPNIIINSNDESNQLISFRALLISVIMMSAGGVCLIIFCTIFWILVFTSNYTKIFNKKTIDIDDDDKRRPLSPKKIKSI